jgi:hypothetical protein
MQKITKRQPRGWNDDRHLLKASSLGWFRPASCMKLHVLNSFLIAFTLFVPSTCALAEEPLIGVFDENSRETGSVCKKSTVDLRGGQRM